MTIKIRSVGMHKIEVSAIPMNWRKIIYFLFLTQKSSYKISQNNGNELVYWFYMTIKTNIPSLAHIQRETNNSSYSILVWK